MTSDQDAIVAEAVRFAENAALAAAELQEAFSLPDERQRSLGRAAEAFRLASLNSSELFAACRALALSELASPPSGPQPAPGPSSGPQSPSWSSGADDPPTHT